MSAASAAAKSTLYRVKESPNAYPPLKSIAASLWHILDNCEVWASPHILNLQCLQLLQETGVNQEAIGSLAPQVRILSDSLRDPFTGGNVDERRREKEREDELNQ